MKVKGIQTIQVYAKNNHVFVKSKVKSNEDQWFPINFQWMPIVKLQEKFIV